MTANLASGPLNMVNELAFIRLYMTSKNAITLTYARGTMAGQIYRPSDDIESMLYEYKIWLYEYRSRETAQKEVPGLYPIPLLSPTLAEYLGEVYRYTRFGEVDRESWMRLISKCAGGLSLVDSTLSLTIGEASMVNKYDVWSGSLEVDQFDEVLRLDDWSRSDTRVIVDDNRVQCDTPLGIVWLDKAAMVETLRQLTGRSRADCQRALGFANWDMTDAQRVLRRV